MKIRKVKPGGQLRWKGSEFYVSGTLIGETVAFEQIDEMYYQSFKGQLKSPFSMVKTKN